jgi:vitamin B12 transporter
MQKRNYIIVSLFVLCCYTIARSQTLDSVQTIQEVVVTANRLTDFSSGTKTQIIDSATINQSRSGNLADLLQNESPLFIKSYGLGSLATSSFRGGSASHTAVLWNGFNINSPMYGQFDLALIPGSFMNKVTIQYGGTSALWGSGAVGGAIHLNNDVQLGKGITIAAGTSVGSFNNYLQNLRIEISKKRWASSVKLFNNTAQNNFPFYNTALLNSNKEIQTNAQLKQYGLLTENYFQINARQKINLCFWYQFSDRNIPPIMLQTVNKSNQKDESYRITSEWQRTGDRITYLARMALFNEGLIYTDSASSIRSLSNSQTFISEAESKIRLHKDHLINIGVNNTYTRATSYNAIPKPEFNGYKGEPSQNRFAVFASYKFNLPDNKFRSTLSVRQELIHNAIIPFTYSWGNEYDIFKWLSAKSNISKVYRLPTFNDLYWFPGGNPKLLPESGFCEEGGLLIKLISPNAGINFSFEPTVFNRNMDNWIIWLPGATYPKPENIMNVWSRGMETKSELGIQLNKIKFRISVLTNYVVSTSERSTTANDASIGKQLIYVPMYSAHAKCSIEYKNFMISYMESYTGYRYTSTDNLEYLKPYMLGNIYAAYAITINSYRLNVFVHVNNLFNEQYQVLLNHAMPLINYQFGLSVQFNKPNTKN